MIKKYITKSALMMFACLLLGACSGDESLKSEELKQQISPIEIKVVVVTMFEIGNDEGDKPGEFQLWKQGQKLNTCLPFVLSHHDICMNKETGVLGIVTGMGIAKASTAIMALGLDPRFDLRKAYWLVAGIAGFDPQDASIGSAAWATWLVDGDLAHQIDARQIPTHWESGYFPLFQTETIAKGDIIDLTKLNRHGQSSNGEVYQLNAQLSTWAYELTKDLKLNDYPAMQALRAKYVGYPNALRPPFVLMGDHMAASTFWHGDLLNQWANTWVYYWTGGEGNFVSSGMEDTGSYQAMIYLHEANKVDKSRFMVLRTASNYSMQAPGMTPLENLQAESSDSGYAGMQSSLESAYIVGSKVVDTIVENWSVYKEMMPYETRER